MVHKEKLKKAVAVKRRIWIGAAAVVLLAYVVVSLWQVGHTRSQAADAYLERQLWLARQGALFLERQGSKDLASLAAAVEGLTISEGRLAESHMSLFDRRRETFLPLLAAPPALDLQVAGDPELRRRLARGAHGGLVLALADERWLVTHLPLNAGDAPLTLILATPESEIVAPWYSFARVQLAGQSILLMVAAALGWRLRLRPETPADGSEDVQPGLQDTLAELQNQCRALAQENALLGAVRREYQLLVEGAEYGTARLNSNGLILFCSKPLLALCGCERTDLVGRNLLDLDIFADDARKKLRKSLGDLRKGVATPPHSCMLARSGDGPLEVQVKLSALRVDGETTGYVLQVQQSVCAEPYLRASLS